jgi:protein O-GlcNAc transferase
VSDSLTPKIQEALRRGDTKAAEDACRRAMAKRPRDVEAPLQLARLLRARGDRGGALTALQQAVTIDPRLAAAWRDLAVLALESHRIDAAEPASARWRALEPQQPQSAFLRGHVLALLHRFDESEREFDGIRHVSGIAASRLGLVGDALARGDAAAARFHAERLVDWLPHEAAAWDALGQAAAAIQDWPASTAALARATELAPENLPLWQRRAAALDAARRGGDELVTVRERLLALQPDSASAREQLGLALIGAQRSAAAVDCFQQLHERDPQNRFAQWITFHTPALPCFASDAARAQWRHDFERGIASFERDEVDADTAQRILGSVTSFALAYQDGALVDLHQRHARLVRRLLDRATNGAYADIAARTISRSRRRIGIVSSCLYQHSVTRAWGEALLALPAETFELHVFHTGTRDDAMTQRFRARADRYSAGAERFSTWTTRLREADLDVLVFLDLGLDVVTQCLAALRHAPVQVSTWAHPVTSGTGTIDYFVSAQGPEPAGADAHYSETLIRLPRLGGCFLAPASPPVPQRAGAGPARLLCAQNLHKLHPQHDAVFARILAGAPGATLDFLPAASAEQIAGFEARLQPVLVTHGVDPARVRIHATLSADAYRQQLADADLLLDTFGFSGGITTLDALWQERPWLTLPGECMRGRQSAAMLRQLGLDELVAASSEDYVAKAIALTATPEHRIDLSRRIAERKHGLFDDHEVAAAFADFLQRVQPRQTDD